MINKTQAISLGLAATAGLAYLWLKHAPSAPAPINSEPVLSPDERLAQLFYSRHGYRFLQTIENIGQINAKPNGP